MTAWLTGWKAIARYIDTSISTAKRWVNERGMPVYTGNPTNRPRAKCKDLDCWLKDNEKMTQDDPS